MGIGETQGNQDPTSGVRIGWLWRHPAGAYYHGFQFSPQETTDRVADWKLILDRFLCHLLVDRLPDEGLAELKQQLVNAIEFYSYECAPSLPPPVPERRTAQIVNRYDRECPVLDEG